MIWSERRLLIVAYQFPPLGGVGPQRALSLCRYLPEHGFEVHVLTPRNGVSHTRDASLINRIPPNVQVHRSFTPEMPYKIRTALWKMLRSDRRKSKLAQEAPARPASGITDVLQKALFPDPQRAWALTAIPAAVRIVRKYGVGAVLVTAPPFSTLMIGVAVKQHCPGIRLISDFRDEWLDFYISDVSAGTTRGARARAEKAQARIVHESDVVIAVTPSSLHRIRAHSPAEPESKFVHIPNGYDPEITPFVERTVVRPLAGVRAATASAIQERTSESKYSSVCTAVSLYPRLPHEKLVVTYLGTVYKPNSPAAYLDAVDRLPEEIRAHFETRFIGRIDPEMRAIFQNRQSSIKLFGFLPQAEALRYLADSDYVLAAMLNGQTVVAKTYEYLASGLPILAVTPAGGEVARLVRETQAGWFADPGQPADLDEMLRIAYSRWVERRPFISDRASIERYDRRQLAGEFAQIIAPRGKDN